MMKYETFRYIWPPRPDLFHYSQIGDLGKDWVAQIKLNGTRTEVYVFPDGKIEFWTRHGEKHKAYKPTEEMKQSILSLNFKKGEFQVFDGELLHSKSKRIKNTFCVYDIFVFNSEYLYKSDYAERYFLLNQICRHPTNLFKQYGVYKVNKNIWLSHSFNFHPKDVWEWAKKQNNELIEGIVLKKSNGKLGYHFNSDKCNWMGKVRKETRLYHF